ncbi:MAG TPA: type II secretion system protein N [Rhizomicrobium sp.]|jgi:type II secretory pathway component PulC
MSAPGGLLVAVSCLCAVLFYQVLAPVAPVETASVVTPVLKPGPILPSYTPPPESDFAIINARALFDPARQPVEEPKAQGAASASATPPPVSLVGVAIGANKSVALLKKPDEQAAVSVSVGDAVDGWQVTRIARDQVVLSANGTDVTITLRKAAGLPQPVQNTVLPPGK